MYDIELRDEDIAFTNVTELLGSLNLPLMKNSIEQQIRGEISSRQNFLSIVMEKFDKLDNAVEDPDDKREIRYEMINFARDLVFEIIDAYNLGFNDTGDSMEILEILSAMYQFFVIRRQEFTVTFFVNYIKLHLPLLVELCGGLPEDKKGKTVDITTISNQKKSFSPELVFVLSHINEVIDAVQTIGVSPNEFFNIINDGDYSIAMMIEYFDRSQIIGDFVPEYLTRELDDQSSPELSNVRNIISVQLLP